MANLLVAAQSLIGQMTGVSTGVDPRFPAGFPIEEYKQQRDDMQERWRYFDGDGWHEQTKSGADKFPLHINPMRTFSLKHAYTLFGEVPDSAITPIVTKVPATDASAKLIAKDVEDALAYVAFDNQLRSLMMENGIMSQFLGGCVFRIGWSIPTMMHRSGIKISRIIPDYFIGVPDGDDMFWLREAWIATPITAEEALGTYGVRLSNPAAVEILLVEHWTRAVYEVTIEGRPANMRGLNGDWVPMGGPNEDKIVPLVYIPHERVGKFVGLSIIDAIKSTAREYNGRMADEGDMVHRSSRGKLPWYKNVQAGLKRNEIMPGVTALNAGLSQPGVTDGPLLEAVDLTGSTVDTHNFNDALYIQLRRDAMVPAVADGEDEGSQRSALTLAFRMWPLTSHIRSERQNWTDGWNVISEIILIILASKRKLVTDAGLDLPDCIAKIDKKHLGLVKTQRFFPMMPRDREQLVNELVLRAGVHHVSPITAITEYGDVEDPTEEEQLIMNYLKAIAAIDAMGGGGGSKSKPTPANMKPAAPAAVAYQE